MPEAVFIRGLEMPVLLAFGLGRYRNPINVASSFDNNFLEKLVRSIAILGSNFATFKISPAYCMKGVTKETEGKELYFLTWACPILIQMKQ